MESLLDSVMTGKTILTIWSRKRYWLYFWAYYEDVVYHIGVKPDETIEELIFTLRNVYRMTNDNLMVDLRNDKGNIVVDTKELQQLGSYYIKFISRTTEKEVFN